jgi:hypothetical protein
VTTGTLEVIERFAQALDHLLNTLDRGRTPPQETVNVEAQP